MDDFEVKAPSQAASAASTPAARINEGLKAPNQAALPLSVCRIAGFKNGLKAPS
jgi:hypothetical protein